MQRFGRGSKHILCILLTLVMVLALLPVVPLTADASALSDPGLVSFANEVFRLTNVERVRHGLPPLERHGLLANAAQVRAVEIQVHFAHARPDGRSWGTVVDEFGILWTTKGENLARGHTSPQQVVTAWMNSPGHRANILRDVFSYLGIGVFRDSNGRLAWVQLFLDTNDTTYNNIDFRRVFSFPFYVSRYPDVNASFRNNPRGALSHFVNQGMEEGRQGNWGFNVHWYRNANPDLRTAFGNDLRAFFMHFVHSGYAENRPFSETLIGGVNGWRQDDRGNWLYAQVDGTLAVGWNHIGGVWYHFTSVGFMQTGWHNIDGIWYFFQPCGAMRTGWDFIGGVWYFFQPSGAMQTGWGFIDGTWYYFLPSGEMATGWLMIDFEWHLFDGSGAWLGIES